MTTTHSLRAVALIAAAGILLAWVPLEPLLAQASAPPGSPSDDLVLRPGDQVRLQVKDEPLLSGEFPVNEDGTVLAPLVGLVQVTDRPFGEVRADFRRGYARELVEPVVVITPLVRLAVLGEVRMPGVYPVDPTMTLAEVLAGAGGLTPRADAGRISLVRNGEATSARLEPGAPLLAARFQSGDQVVVEGQRWVREHMAVLVGAAASVAAAAVTSLIVSR